jgi:hypothetical protein
MNLRTRPKVLHLDGISWDDYVSLEDKFDAQFISDGEEEPIIETFAIEYDYIPDKYNAKTWPTKCNRPCLNCGLRYNGAPKFIPTYLTRSDIGAYGELIAGVKGATCSWSCSHRFVMDNTVEPDKRWTGINTIQRLAEEEERIYAERAGRDVREIKIDSAPSRLDLNYYLGTLTETEFKKKVGTLVRSTSSSDTSIKTNSGNESPINTESSSDDQDNLKVATQSNTSY